MTHTHSHTERGRDRERERQRKRETEKDREREREKERERETRPYNPCTCIEELHKGTLFFQHIYKVFSNNFRYHHLLEKKCEIASFLYWKISLIIQIFRCFQWKYDKFYYWGRVSTIDVALKNIIVTKNKVQVKSS